MGGPPLQTTPLDSISRWAAGYSSMGLENELKMFPTRQILFTGLGHNDVHRMVSLLEAFEVDFQRVPWGPRVMTAVVRTGFDVVVIGYPTLDIPLESLLSTLRGSGSASRHAGLVLYCSPDEVHTGQQLLGHGVNRVVSRNDPDQAIQESVLSLIDVPRRFHLRAPVHISDVQNRDKLISYCHTENLSMSGMLVNCAHQPDIGALLEFSLLFPEEEGPIRGRARVARIADARREKVMGVGAAFESFARSDRSRLRNALSRRWH